MPDQLGSPMPVGDPSRQRRASWGHGGPKSQSGITLVEVLVSVLIMGLAMISLAGLQSYTVKYQMGSANRAVLAMLIGDYAERVRANLPAAPGFDPAVTSPYLVSASWADQNDLPSPPSQNCESGACVVATDLATWDMYVWRRNVREALPRGSVRVAGSIQAGLNVSLMWQDNDQADPSPECAANQSPADARRCCPAAAGVPNGARCANFLIVP